MTRDSGDPLHVKDAIRRHALPLRNGLRRDAADLVGKAGIAPGFFFCAFECFVHGQIESISFT